MAKSKKKKSSPQTTTAHPLPLTAVDNVAPPVWAVRIAWVLRLLILIGGISQIYFGNWNAGIMTLLALSLIVLPGFFTRGRIVAMPLEVELLLFVIVFVQFVLGAGESGFYNTIPYSDKIIHFAFPFIVGIIGFLMIYTLFYFGKLDASALGLAVVIILVTTGVAAGWEIIEYSSDRWLYPDIIGHHFQGNMSEDAINDTMTDLIMGFAAGIGAALMGFWLVNRAKQAKRPRLYTFLDELQASLSGKKVDSSL